MSDKATDTPAAVHHAGHRDWERIVLGENGIEGTVRLLVYIAVFAIIFGTIFTFLR